MRLLFLIALLSACRPKPPPAPADPLASLKWDASPIDWSRPPAGEIAQAGYVGSEACKKCHAEIYAGYMRHSMARSGLRLLASFDQKWLQSIFDGAPLVRHEKSGFAYRPVKSGKGFFVEEYFGEEKLRTVPITHALSAGSYGMTFYTRQGEHLYQAPLDYYAQVKAWGMDPGNVFGNARFSKLLSPFCISCHSDYPRRRGELAWLDPLPSGIGCERCHGPGERHAKTLLKEDVVNPKNLSWQRQLDVCAQCHLSSFPELRAGKQEEDFRPGRRLDEVRVNFVAENLDAERMELLGHSDRLMRSACFRKAKLMCTTCHDPHKSSFDQPAGFWDGKCVACHQCKQKQTAGCPSCHMRRAPTWNPTQVTATDHFIQRRPPPIQSGRPRIDHLIPATNLMGETLAGDDVAALEVAALAQSGHGEEAQQKVVTALANWPQVPALYEWLSALFGGRNQLGPARAAAAAALRFATDERGALLGYARLSLDANQVSEAMRALDRLIAIDAGDADALELKGIVLLRAGERENAAKLFRQASSGWSAAAAHVGLAVLSSSPDEKRDELEKAHAIEPRDSWILEKLGRPSGARQITAATAWLPERYR